jgi:hypothetical protein
MEEVHVKTGTDVTGVVHSPLILVAIVLRSLPLQQQET